jgi:riboflavin kinase/FMN adenylyltransferase
MLSDFSHCQYPSRVHAAEVLTLAGCVVAIGAFDGVHRGHQQLIRAMIASARGRGVPSVVYTFDPPPKAYFGRARSLISLEEKIGRLSALEVDHIVIAAFDETYRQRTPLRFVAELATMNPRAIWVGKDFRFGLGQVGDVGLLERFFHVGILDPVRCEGGQIISSSRIRALRDMGDVLSAETLQGWARLSFAAGARSVEAARD